MELTESSRNCECDKSDLSNKKGLKRFRDKKLVLASVVVFGIAAGTAAETLYLNRSLVKKYTAPYVEMYLKETFGDIKTIESVEKNYDVKRTFSIKLSKEDIQPITEMNVYTVPLDKVPYTAHTTNKNFPKIPILTDKFPKVYNESKEFFTKTEYTAVIPSVTRLGFNLDKISNNLDKFVELKNNKIYVNASPTVGVTTTQPLFGKHKVVDEKTGIFGSFRPEQIFADLAADQTEVIKQVSTNKNVQQIAPLRANHMFKTYMRGLIDTKYPEFRKYELVTKPIKFDWQNRAVSNS